MKISLVSPRLAVLVAVAAAILPSSLAFGQNMAVFDMNRSLKNYHWLTRELDSMKARAIATDKDLMEQAKSVQKLQEALKLLDTNSQDYTARYQDVSQATAKLNSDQAMKKKEFSEMRTKLLYQAYMAVHSAVHDVAQQYKISIVMQYDNFPGVDGFLAAPEPPPAADGSKPMPEPDPSQNQQALQVLMMRPVVYVEKGFDITNLVIESLNRSEAQAGRPQQPIGVPGGQVPR